MSPTEVAIMSAAVVAFACVSRVINRYPITMPMVFVALGSISEAVGVVELEFELETVSLISEVTLAVILFSDAVRLNVPALRHQAGLPARLLLIGMPLQIALGTIGIWLLLPLDVWEAALIAAILAPTDAALGQAVVEDDSVPLRIRQGLNVESGFNDGLALPAVLAFLALATGEEGDPGFWTRFALEAIGLGVVVGIAVGAIGASALSRARHAGWVDGIYAQLAVLALALTAFAGAEMIDANGFIAAFVAGLTFGSVMDPHLADHLDEYTEDTGRGLAMVAFFLFGNVLLNPALEHVTPLIVLCAALTLTVGRMLPVAIAMADMRPARETVLFVGWFGPRGLASILFGLIVLEEELAGAEELFGVIAWTVLASVFLHGATAGWGARRYARWYESMSDEEKETMPEAVDVPDTRVRWGG